MIKRLIFLIVFTTVFSSTAEDFFTSCRFHFGTEMSRVYDMDQKKVLNQAIIDEIDYFTGPWVGSADEYNIGNFFIGCKKLGKTPVAIGYVIAFAAYRDKGIRDCNASNGSNSLCVKGANYIRNNKDRILGIYDRFAKGIAKDYGTEKPLIWCMEPDYSQYAESMQEGGGLSKNEAAEFMNSILSTIKRTLPKSLFSMDISPWKDTNWQNAWFTTLNVKKNYSFINTSGGQSKAASKFISDDWSQSLPTWSWVQKQWGKPVLADAGYGVSGGSTGHDSKWDDITNLNNRINEGVLGVAQYNPRSDWAITIKKNRSKLLKPPQCPQTTEIQRSFRNTTFMQPVNFREGEYVDVIDLSGRTVASFLVDKTPLKKNIYNHAGIGVFLIRSQNRKTVSIIVKITSK